MPLGQKIIDQALTHLAVRGQGETVSASESQDALDELNNMWASWGIDEGLIFAVQPISLPLAANVGAYSIGPGAASPFNIAVPSRIYAAYIVTGAQRNNLKIVDAATYYDHNDLSASSSVPDELYPDFDVDKTTGQASLFLYPVPTGTPQLEMTAAATFSSWALAVNYNIPQGFYDALTWALAWRLAPSYGSVVSEQIMQAVQANGSKAEARIREMNAVNRKLPGPVVLSPEQTLMAAAGPKA